MYLSDRLSPASYQLGTAETAQYEHLGDPVTILLAGLKDEVVELIDEAYGPGYWDGSMEGNEPERPLDQDTWKGELGDIAWYISELSSVEGIPLAALDSAATKILEKCGSKNATVSMSLGKIANFHPREALDYADTAVYTKPVVCLCFLVVRVDEALRGAGKNIYGEDLDVFSTLCDLWCGMLAIAQSKGFGFEEIAQTNLAKLAKRARKPHTITHTELSLPSSLDVRKKLWLLSLQD